MKILMLCTTDSMIWNFLVPHIKELEKRGHEVECACSETGFYYSELEKQGIILHKMSFTRTPISKSNIKAFNELKKLIRTDGFDAVYCHEPVGGMMGRFSGKVNKIKVIYMSHGFHFFCGAPLKHWLFYFVAEWIMSFMTDACITINREDYERACKMHAKRNYYVHGVGIQPKKKIVNTERHTIRSILGISEDDILLISVGELSIRKNHQIILQAMKLLGEKNLKLVICGEGKLENTLKNLVNRYQLSDNVKFTGFVRNISDYLAASDVMILPSLWEGLGLAALEALQICIPVIGSRRQGIMDYIVDGETGYLFDPNKPDDLVEKLKKLKENDYLKVHKQKMTEMAVKYDLSSVIKEFALIYDTEFYNGKERKKRNISHACRKPNINGDI